MNCAIGGERIEPDADPPPWREMAGFERPSWMRSDGVGSSLVGRGPTGRWACHKHAFDLSQGIDPRQGTLQIDEQ